jgi:hypothetical protein
MMLVSTGLDQEDVIVRGRADREEEPTRVVVVEPISVREDIAALMIGLDEETLRGWRKLRTGPPFRKAGRKVVLYMVEELREWVKSCPAPLANLRAH